MEWRWTLWALAALVIGALSALWWSPATVTVHYRREREDDVILLRVRALYGLIRWHKRVSGIQAGPNLPQRPAPSGSVPPAGRDASPTTGKTTFVHVWDLLRDLPEWRARMRVSGPYVRRMLRHTVVRRCSVHLRVGTGDVVTCGMAYGAVWSMVSSALGWMSRLCVFQDIPDLVIVPDFEHRVFHAAAECIMEIRAGYAIIAGLGLIRALRRRMADGTPYSRLDADRHEQYS